MNLHKTQAAALAATVVVLSMAVPCLGTPPRKDALEEFRKALEKIAPYPADPCNPPDLINPDVTLAESQVFSWAANFVTQEMNAAGSQPKFPQERATEALRKLEGISSEINKAWPDENRFHFQILDVSPALVVKMTIRTNGTFSVFGIPELDSGKPNHAWKEVGANDESNDERSFNTSLDLYPLYRGPSGNARFLANFSYNGCAGNSMGVEYKAWEWNPKDEAGFDQIIRQEGSIGIDAAPKEKPTSKDPFAPIGALSTKGPLIMLPYCWFSAVDTWDNPSLCAVDTYDLSGDSVRFRSRAFNRPDLVPVAKAIEYAEKRDYAATLGYCASSDVAHRMVRDFPPNFFAGELGVTATSNGRERVELGDPTAYRFGVEKRNGRWMAVSFSEE